VWLTPLGGAESAAIAANVLAAIGGDNVLAAIGGDSHSLLAATATISRAFAAISHTLFYKVCGYWRRGLAGVCVCLFSFFLF